MAHRVHASAHIGPHDGEVAAYGNGTSEAESNAYKLVQIDPFHLIPSKQIPHTIPLPETTASSLSGETDPANPFQGPDGASVVSGGQLPASEENK